MKPYRNIKTRNPGLLLLFARVAAYLGILFFIFASLLLVAGFFPIRLPSPILLYLIPMAVGILFSSGIMAAIVAFEERYRLRTEHLIRASE